MEYRTRGDGEKIQIFLHRIEGIVQKGLPDDIEGTLPADNGAERTNQARRRGQRIFDHTMEGIRSRYLQRKAQENLMEKLNTTWNEFSTRINQRDVSFQNSSNFLKDDVLTTTQMSTLGQQMKNLRS